MPVFADTPSASPLSVDVGRFVYAIASPTSPDWTFGPWRQSRRLGFQSAFCGSSIAGPSSAKSKLAIGAPATDDALRVEDAPDVGQGDRLCIGIADGNNVRWIWAGYQTQANINVSDTGEGMDFRHAGPEWAWTAEAVVGQLRLTAAGEDRVAGGSPAVQGVDTRVVLTFPAVFNPGGKGNRSATAVAFGERTGRVFQTPGRAGTDYWTMRDAVRYLLLAHNPAYAAIGCPDETELEVVPDERMAETPVDGLNLWDALRRVLGSAYGFYVDPRPRGRVEGANWGPFDLRVFARGQGPPADLWLNPLGTPMTQARASVIRVEAAKDITKVVNDVTVLGRTLKQVRLVYYGGGTPPAGECRVLQAGWTTADLNVADYGFTPTVTGGEPTVDRLTVEWTDPATWARRYRTDGAEFEKYRHAGRLLVWNEDAAEPGRPAPDLTPLLGEGYVRRRRRLFGIPVAAGAAGGKTEVEPILYVGVAQTPAQTPETIAWVRVPANAYKVDPDRAAVWVTARDLADWCPMEHQLTEGVAGPPDCRTYATLLAQGRLRLMLEACVETDDGILGQSPRQEGTGCPLRRSAFVRNDGDFARVELADGASPAQITAEAIDDTAVAAEQAQRLRDVGQQQQVHASVLVCADWPKQPIGSVITGVRGRVVNLQNGFAGGDGAQVVAMNMDAGAMAWELLTESVALALRSKDRIEISAGGQKVKPDKGIRNKQD